MKIGITGTRNGMTSYQRDMMERYLKAIISYNCLTPYEFHHGDCIGVDVESAQIAKDLGYKIVCHPPEKDGMRGFFPSDEYKKPLTYFARNRNIVDTIQALYVVPKDLEIKTQGGTWYTYNYAVNKKKMKNVFIIWP